MTTELAAANFRRPRQPVLPASFLVVAEVLGLPMPRSFDAYRLRRCREGTDVYLIDQETGFEMNFSLMKRVQPANFREARRWVAAVAAGHGVTLVEVKRGWRR
jgi:hypothetical protein